MLCKQCKNKYLVRGLKQITCRCCEIKTRVNLTYESGICENCSDTLLICQRCGNSVREQNQNQGFDIICRDCGSKNKTITEYDEFSGISRQCTNCGQEDYSG